MDKLDFLRALEKGEITFHSDTVNIREFIKKLIDDMSEDMRRNYLHCRYQIENISASDIVIDRKALEILFSELLKNAIHFTPDGGDVIVNISEMHSDGQTVKLEAYIQDNGIGMPQEFLKEMYAPYAKSRMDPKLEGEGLGLAIVKKLVDRMGGRISCETGKGLGTIFRLILTVPIASLPYTRPAVPNMQRDIYNFSGKHILLVDDHPLNLQIAQDMLISAGCYVTTAENGQEAIDLFLDDEEFFDLILMDIRMPVMDGIEAARAIRAMESKKAQSIPIIALTASAYEGDIHRSSTVGMNESVLKPIDPKKLFGILSRFLFQQ
jgi:CheY-like chemotaxis protein